jgi:MFS transporter, DHA2 family, multidrug resistance protein
MSAALASSTAVDGHRAITVAALMATYMEAVNISLPNAALPHIQGTLSMANDEVGWVFTAYIAAGAAVMPLARWLAGRYGRKTIYQVSLAVFSLGLMLDTLATTSIQFVFARIVQGAASGTLAPLSLAILLDVLPPARHARLSLAWSVCLVLGISSGASIGGWLSEYHGWPNRISAAQPPSGRSPFAERSWLLRISSPRFCRRIRCGSASLYAASADYTHRLPGNLPQFGAASAGTGADGDGVHSS